MDSLKKRTRVGRDARRTCHVASALACLLSLVGCDRGDPCDAFEPVGCGSDTESKVLAEWKGETPTDPVVVEAGRLAAQGDHLLLIDRDVVHRIPKRGGDDAIVAAAEPGLRFFGMAEDGGFVYFTETNALDAAPGSDLVTRIRRVAPDGTTIETLADTAAPVEGLSVVGSEAWVWFCRATDDCSLDRIDLTDGAKVETALSFAPVDGTKFAFGADTVDYVGRQGAESALVRLDRATGEVIASTAFIAGLSVTGPVFVGDRAYVGTSSHVLVYPTNDPEALDDLAPRAADPRWDADVGAIVGDARAVYFHGSFSPFRGFVAFGGWSGTATYDAVRERYDRVTDFGFYTADLETIALDEGSLYFVAFGSTCLRYETVDWGQSGTCVGPYATDRRLVRVSR